MTERLGSFATLVTDVRDRGRLPLVRLEAVQAGTGRLADGELPEVDVPDAGAALARSGDVLFGKLRPYLAKTWRVDRDVYASTELMCLRPRPRIDAGWLGYLTRSRAFVEWAVATSDGAKMPRTSWERLRSFRTIVPPLDEQRAIADYLDRETARIDALIAAKQQMSGLVWDRFVTERVSLVVGPGWQMQRLKFVAHMDSGHTPNRQVPEYWVDCTIPWITLNDVSQLERSWRFSEPLNAINELGMQNSSAHLVPEGSVVLSRDATVGKSALLGRPMAVSQHFVTWTCGSRLLPEYLLHVFRGPMQTYFGSLTAGATIATIGMPDLGQLTTPVPPLAEQRRIVDQIATAESRASSVVGALRRQIGLLQERRQALITAAVTGQLLVPVPA